MIILVLDMLVRHTVLCCCILLWMKFLLVDKMAVVLADDNFRCIFINENYWIPIRISLKFVPRMFIWQQTSIGSGNGLALNRRQGIIWTNADSVQWRIFAALGGDELIPPGAIYQHVLLALFINTAANKRQISKHVEILSNDVTYCSLNIL